MVLLFPLPTLGETEFGFCEPQEKKKKKEKKTTPRIPDTNTLIAKEFSLLLC